MTAWLFYGAFAAIALVFLAIELAGWRLDRGWTVSELAWLAVDRYGWAARSPLLAAWLVLGSHLLLRHPR